MTVEEFQKYFEPRTLARLNGLELRARTIVEGYVSGVHRSPYHGFSVEFAEHREYVPGDDTRYIDWKVFGKTDKFYLKQYEQETNLITYLLLDTSESMRYQGPQAAMSKLEYAKCAAAAIAYLVLNQQDSVSLATFDNEVRTGTSQQQPVAHQAIGPRNERDGPSAKNGHRSDPPRPCGAAQEARRGGHYQ